MLDSADLIHANAWQQMVNAIKMKMIDFLQKMLDLYNQANGGIDGIEAIKGAIDIENKFRSNNDKIYLKRVASDLRLEEDYIAYKISLEVGD